MSNPTNKYGLTAVPASAQDLLTSTHLTQHYSTNRSPNPNPRNPTSTAHQCLCTHTPPRPDLQPLTTSVSFRACKRYRFLFADWDLDDEAFLLACLLHDIGATEANITATRLSFAFFGGVLALRVLQNDTHEDEDEANVSVHVRERGSPSGLRARDGPA